MTHHSVNSHVQQFTGSNKIKYSVNILKNGYHHFVFILRSWSKGVGKVKKIHIMKHPIPNANRVESL